MALEERRKIHPSFFTDRWPPDCFAGSGEERRRRKTMVMLMVLVTVMMMMKRGV